MMQNFILDLMPVLLFFILFQYQGIYAATWGGIIATTIQVLVYRWYYKHWEKTQIIALTVFVIFGGMTLYFHNPLFVKWKPTIIFWVFALILCASHLIGQKPIIHSLIEKSLDNNDTFDVKQLPAAVGKLLNASWIIFFSVMGAVNIYIAYNFSDRVWVQFKLYAIPGCTMLISILQTIYLLRYLKVKQSL